MKELVKVVEGVANSLKSYDGLNGCKLTDVGFDVALKNSKDILDKSLKGHRGRKVVVAVTRGGYETMYDIPKASEASRNIVGLAHIIDGVKKYIVKNNLSCIQLDLELLEIKGYKGRFIIPFEEVDYDISRCILLLIEKGWVLSAYENSGNKYYVVYSLVIDSEGWKPINSCYEELEFLEKILKKKGYSYIMEISLKEYLEDTKYQDLMDYVLFNNRVPNNDNQ